MSEIQEMQCKRAYLEKLNNIYSQLSELDKFPEINNRGYNKNPYQFDEQLDEFLEYLINEIEYQEKLLSDKEVTIYNMLNSTEDKK